MHKKPRAIAASKTFPHHIWVTMFFVFALFALMATSAFAGTNTGMGIVLCNVAAIAQGNLGQAIAILAVIVIGVGASLGKVSWGLAITVAVGIAIVFNAASIVLAMGIVTTCGAVS